MRNIWTNPADLLTTYEKLTAEEIQRRKEWLRSIENITRVSTTKTTETEPTITIFKIMMKSKSHSRNKTCVQIMMHDLSEQKR
jgi:hypothetical protein